MSVGLFEDARDDYFTRGGTRGDAPPFFVGRRDALEAAGSALQADRHLLYLGPRGVGKTYCLWQLAAMVRQGALAEVSVGAVPIRSDEDFRNFPDLQEFVLDLFWRLGQELAVFDREASLRIVGRGQREQDAGAHRAYADRVLTGPWRVDRRPFFEQVARDIRDTCRMLGRRAVLFLENVDDFAGRILKNDLAEQAQFLRFLDQAHLSLIASSTTFPAEWTQADHPFCGLFDTFTLQEFSPEEAREMLMRLAEHQQDATFRHEIEHNDDMLHTLYPFTDGNARSLAMCYTAVRARHGQKKNIRRALSTLLSASTPYYQERLKRHGLNGLRLKVLIHLVRSGQPLSPGLLAHALGEEEGAVQTALAWLLTHHYVKSQDGQDPDGRYTIKDTLFRVWMEVRQTPDSFQRITHLVSFFETLYEGKDPLKEYPWGMGDVPPWESTPEDHNMLKARLNAIWSRSLPDDVYAKGKALYDAHDAEGLWAYHGYLLRNRVLTDRDQVRDFETLVAVFLFFLRDFHQANALFDTLFHNHSVDSEEVWLVYSRSLLLGQERLDTVLAFNEKWRQELPGAHLSAYYHLGVACLMAGRCDEAVEAFDQCLSFEFSEWGVRKPAVLANKGQALLLNGRVEEALACCLQALSVAGGETIPQLHRNLVGIYLTMGDGEKAHAHLKRTIHCLRAYRDSRNLDMSLRILFQFIDDTSPLVDDSVELVETFLHVTRHGLNQVRIQRLMNDLITEGKLAIAEKIVGVIKRAAHPTVEMFLPYVYAFSVFNMENIRDRHAFKKGLLPELRGATEIIVQMIQMAQERVPGR